tara:strand:- start:214 stop:459 length:246 start_codon:yes stop_codon:yes gene_type:complete
MGIFRSFFRAVTQAVAAPQVQAPVAQTATAPTTTTDANKKASLGSGYGSKGTIMSSSEGVEDDANISKTVLGAGNKKKIKA